MIPILALVNVLLLVILVFSGYALYQRMTSSMRDEISLVDLPVSPKRDVSFSLQSETPSNEGVVNIL